jgi:predicted phage tail protein
VAAFNSVGIGESATVSATPLAPVTVPSAPKDVVSVAGNGSAMLSWTAPSSNGGAPIDYYVVYLNGADTAHVTGTQYEVRGLTNGVSYHLSVAAHNSAGTGPSSNVVVATPLKPATVPGVPTQLVATPGDGQVQLSWRPPANDGGSAVLGYRLYWSQDPNGKFTLIPISGTSYLQSGLGDGLTYYYKVAAVNQVGEGPATEIVSVTTVTPLTLPSAPTNVFARSESGAVVLSWNAPANDGGSPITHYLVYRGSDGGSMVWIGSATGLAYTDGEVDPGLYNYRVVAVNAVGVGALSEVVSVTVGAAPEVPSSISLGNVAIVATVLCIGAMGLGAIVKKRRVRR